MCAYTCACVFVGVWLALDVLFDSVLFRNTWTTTTSAGPIAPKSVGQAVRSHTGIEEKGARHVSRGLLGPRVDSLSGDPREEDTRAHSLHPCRERQPSEISTVRRSAPRRKSSEPPGTRVLRCSSISVLGTKGVPGELGRACVKETNETFEFISFVFQHRTSDRPSSRDGAKRTDFHDFGREPCYSPRRIR